MACNLVSQYARLLLTLCKLKGYRFLLLIVVLACAFSNHFLYSVVKSSLSALQLKEFEPIGPEEFSQQNIILADWKTHAEMQSNMKDYYLDQGASAEDMFETCSDTDSCNNAVFKTLFNRRSDKFRSLVKYPSISKNMSEILCQTSHGREMHCALLGSLVLMSQISRSNKLRRFRTVKMFQVVIDTGISRTKLKEKNTMCSKELDFSKVLPRTVMVQIVILLCGVAFYLITSTVPCIGDLKGRGFLQLLFRRGMSVLAYWLALWTLTMAELLLAAVALVVSYHVQCPGYYPSGSLVQVFAVTVGELACMTSLIFLLTIIMRNFYHVGIATVLLTMLCTSLIVLLRMMSDSLGWIRLTSLLLPPGHLAEQIQANLLSHVVPKGRTSYHQIAFIISYIAFASLSVITFYLDFVLTAGNGFRLPFYYILSADFWVLDKHDPLVAYQPEKRPTIEEVDSSLLPIVRARRLVKEFTEERKNSFAEASPSKPAIAISSVTIYNGQITAIVGHSQSGKTTLLNMLATSDTLTSGSLSVNGCNLRNAMAGMHICGKIGICLQRNSLCHGLTLDDTLALMTSSSGQTDGQLEVDSLLSILHLGEKRLTKVGSMSPGQRRKLCFALALFGDPQIVVLDEPTNGVDPFSKRRMWKLLQEFKRNRCIVLSTQRMEEADTLADHKIFLSGGTIICAGSTPFLKRVFDCGFVFQITLKTERHVKSVLREMHAKFKKVRARSIFRSQFELQIGVEDVHLLPTVAEEFERLVDFVDSIALTQTSLDEVFIRLKGRTPTEVENLFTSGDIGFVVNGEEDLELSETPQTNEPKPLSTAQNDFHIPASKWKSAGLLVNIMKLRLLRSTSRLVSRLVTAIVLLVILTAAVAFEKTLENHKIKVHFQISNARHIDMSFGNCLYDKDAIYGGSNIFHGRDSIRLCLLALRNSNDTSAASLTGISVQSKLRKEKVSDYYLNNPDSVNELVTFCLQFDKCKTPYPAVYISNMCDCPVEYNKLRDIHIGFFVEYDSFSAPLMAHAAVGALQRMFNFYVTFLTKIAVESRLLINAIYEYRTMTIPTLGAFFQLIIIMAVPAMYLDDIIEDKMNKVRHTMSTMGMSCLSYWFAVYFVHWLQCTVVYLLSALIMICILPKGYLCAYYLVGIVLPTLILGITNNQLFVYLISTFIDRPNSLMAESYYFIGVVNALLIMAVQHNHYVLALIFLVPPFATITPTFYGSKAIFYAMSYHKVQTISEVSGKLGLYFMQTNVLYSLIAMVLHTIILSGLIVASEWCQEMLPRLRHPKPTNCDYQECDDPGVKKESERIRSYPKGDTNVLEVSHLQKIYPDGTKAVRDLTFGVKAGEILGLIGPSGSGKTTTLDTIVGENTATSGVCTVWSKLGWLPSKDVISTGAIGYCPQYSPLFDQITVREHLVFYANLLGLDTARAASRADQLMHTTGLDSTKDSRVGALPYGRQRLLCLAISMLGNPPLLILDEASTGVDPHSRRAMWTVIKSYVSDQRSVMLTTHSLDEAEFLCNRIGIVNHGFLIGLGGLEDIRVLYGQYYCLDIQFTEGMFETDNMISAVTLHFPTAKILDHFTSRVVFSIPTKDTGTLSATLRWICENRTKWNIKFFTYRQMSLDCVLEAILLKHDLQMQTLRRRSIFSAVTELSDEMYEPFRQTNLDEISAEVKAETLTDPKTC